ncbi:MAG TPA: site-2 protease family protein [Polyangia bacterium]|jgi:Zn-dependent protease/CBS domain-containing protein
MFGRGYPLFRLLGFQVRVGASWSVLAVLVTWSLATGLFPFAAPGRARSLYWAMGAVGAVGLFASIVVHELAHSVVARRFGLPLTGITLFIFGGVAEMNEEPPSARAELAMAAAGPVLSLGIGAVLLALRLPLPHSAPRSVIGYLGAANLLLAAFNLVPAFPLDGGRVLRAVLWRARGDVLWATRISSAIGAGVGVALMVLGGGVVLRGNLITGLWWFLIGLFLRGAARGAYGQLLAREALRGAQVHRFMKTAVVTVPPWATLRELDERVRRHGYTVYPVTAGERLIGCINADRARATPPEDWDRRTVGSLVEPLTPDNTVAPDSDVLRALEIMERSGRSRLLVVEGEELIGIVALSDLVAYVAARLAPARREVGPGWHPGQRPSQRPV